MSYLLNKRQKKKLAKREGARHYDKRSALEASLKNENDFTIGWYKRRFGREWKEEYLLQNIGKIGRLLLGTPVCVCYTDMVMIKRNIKEHLQN